MGRCMQSRRSGQEIEVGRLWESLAVIRYVWMTWFFLMALCVPSLKGV